MKTRCRPVAAACVARPEGMPPRKLRRDELTAILDALDAEHGKPTKAATSWAKRVLKRHRRGRCFANLPGCFLGLRVDEDPTFRAFARRCEPTRWEPPLAPLHCNVRGPPVVDAVAARRGPKPATRKGKRRRP